MRYWRIWLLLAALTGCAAPPARPLEVLGAPRWQAREPALAALTQWDLAGRIALKGGLESWSADLRWQQRQSAYDIHLIGPLGQGNINLVGDNHRAVLSSANGETLYAEDPAALFEQKLGVRLPVADLRYWVTGRPAPGSAVQRVQLDEAGRLAQLQQADWRIDYRGYMTVGDLELPQKIVVENSPLTLRMVIDRWTLP